VNAGSKQNGQAGQHKGVDGSNVSGVVPGCCGGGGWWWVVDGRR
jgi:hypothetical protein